jgi:hypothetical protein
MDPTTIRFPARWIDASTLEQILLNGPSPFSSSSPEVHFHIPSKCSLMTDAAVRLLSLLNQLDSTTRRVVVHFEGGKHGVLAYLERIGFFQALAANVTVMPKRPTGVAAMRYQGRNPHVVEIHRIYHHQREDDLPNRLTTAITLACKKRHDVRELEAAAWTILAELIDNVFSHSETRLDGFAALQVYPKGNCVKVAVSDSGRGMLETLRPALRVESPKLAALSDVDLIVEVFRQGLSRHGTSRGCGLKGCADKAVKFGASLDVRLPESRVLLVPGKQGYTPSRAFCYPHLPLIWGTHICFTFELD